MRVQATEYSYPPPPLSIPSMRIAAYTLHFCYFLCQENVHMVFLGSGKFHYIP